MHNTLMVNWGYVLLLFILGAISYKRKSLDMLGSLIMIFMGITIIFSAGVSWFILIVLFFILSIGATRFSKPYKKEIGQYEKTRTAKNVISNGLVAFLMAAFGSYYLPLAGGFIGAVATATADTLASEIGVLQEPRLITSFRKVPAGTDGAISVLGTCAAIVGAGVIGFASFLLGIMPEPLVAIKISVISGTVGCFIDSILGAVLERREYINNEHVNLLATICGAIIGIVSVM